MEFPTVVGMINETVLFPNPNAVITNPPTVTVAGAVRLLPCKTTACPAGKIAGCGSGSNTGGNMKKGPEAC